METTTIRNTSSPRPSSRPRGRETTWYGCRDWQAAQNNYLVNTLRPSPAPAYVVQNPYCCNGGGYGYGCGAVA